MDLMYNSAESDYSERIGPGSLLGIFSVGSQGSVPSTHIFIVGTTTTLIQL